MGFALERHATGREHPDDPPLEDRSGGRGPVHRRADGGRGPGSVLLSVTRGSRWNYYGMALTLPKSSFKARSLNLKRGVQ